ncbi:MAG: TonB-dependent receptor [Gammaproteobacteria bacterium]|nr:TonB-dependent receptor [Gammaproteobacteria bacterium]
MDKNVSSRNTREKALRLNLDLNKYGTIAEIGAGQEVARQFFKAGGAAGTIAKTISAYDMKFSDAIYGAQDDGRYVSESRVKAMLEKEFDLVINRVGTSRSKASRFFAYGTTIAAKSYKGDNECHAWCGIRIQMYPNATPSEIVVHVRMRDNNADRQQSAMGTFGVNLIYAAFYYFEDPKTMIDSLTDDLEQDRIEIDSIEFTGPYFEDLDNRAINLHLIRSWKTRAIMFKPDGTVITPAEMLYKKNVLTIRGTFRPITRLNVDMIEQGLKSFAAMDGVDKDNIIALAEISLNDMRGNDLKVSEEDLIERVSLLNSLGYSVMVTDYTRYFSLRAYFRQFTKMQIGIVVGIVNIREIFDESSYRGVEGGILEGFGKLFPDNTHLLVYPEIDQFGNLRDYSNVDLPDNLQYLYKHLLKNNFILGIESSDHELFKIFSREILARLPNGRGDWEKSLPDGVADLIIEHKLFGYKD